ncbi:hypothetical protein [Mycoavidus sp. B2-EB]|uniref:IS66 family insertion sequence element accessory protein TnpA n=1 Tax=Mycoavidus sp. B2-EB TaxID=2651972 RepID=UPI001623A769|nr:hypothetical protein [Mycoavidus sp. B2-EB]
MAKKTLSAKIWSEHLLSARKEGLSLSDYAKREGLSRKALYYWKKKLSVVGERVEPKQESKFVSLRVSEKTSEPRLCSSLILASGVRLELSGVPSPEWLIALGRAAQGVR